MADFVVIYKGVDSSPAWHCERRRLTDDRWLVGIQVGVEAIPLLRRGWPANRPS